MMPKINHLKQLFFSFCIQFTMIVHAQPGFVMRSGDQFRLNDKAYYFIGTNYWYGGILGQTLKGRARLTKELDFLKNKGILSLRVLAAVEGSGPINGMARVPVSYQPEKGVFNKDFLHGLDFLLNEMDKRGMKAVLFLSNNWEWSGGFLQYLNWNGLLPDSILRRKLSWDENRDYVKQFYSCKPCKESYLKQLKSILLHKNTISKKAYINDPVIMAWEVANEPRPMRPTANAEYENWLKEVSAAIKQIDKKHLVTLGVEGEMGTENMDLFKRIHADKNVDYLTIHIWPKNWGWFKDTAMNQSFDQIISKASAYITNHTSIAIELKKPIVIEEFGLPRDNVSFSLKSSTVLRNKYYDYIFSKWLENIRNKGNIAGLNFWSFGGYGKLVEGRFHWKAGDDFTGDPPVEEQGLNSVFVGDASTWKLIESYLHRSKIITK